MNRRHLLLRLLFKAAWVRKDRALTALISVAVVATIATAALTIYSDLEGKLSREFRGFGANVIVTKASGAITADELGKDQCCGRPQCKSGACGLCHCQRGPMMPGSWWLGRGFGRLARVEFLVVSSPG